MRRSEIRAIADIEYIDHWDAPSEDDDPVKILTMPNVPKPLHGLAPRTIMGNTAWNYMRKKCYAAHDYKCEVCGADPKEFNQYCHAHELYEYDYPTGEAKFVRCVCLCPRCHIYPGVHTGRALTLYKKHDIFMSKKTILEGLEQTFRLIHEYNVKHPDEKPLRLFTATLEFMTQDELCAEVLELIHKYDIKFYDIKASDTADWDDWHLLIGNKEHKTPYADYDEWQEAMEKNNEEQTKLQKEFMEKESFKEIIALINESKSDDEEDDEAEKHGKIY